MGKKLTGVIEPEAKEELQQSIDSKVNVELEQNNNEKTVSDNKEAVFIYVGPPNNYLSRYSLYRNGLPPHMIEHFETFPILKSLFIDPDKLSEFERNLNQDGSIESIWYGEAKKYFEGKVN